MGNRLHGRGLPRRLMPNRPLKDSTVRTILRNLEGTSSHRTLLQRFSRRTTRRACGQRTAAHLRGSCRTDSARESRDDLKTPSGESRGNTEMWCYGDEVTLEPVLKKTCWKLRNQPTQCSRHWAARKSSGLPHLALGAMCSPVKSCSIEGTNNTVSSSSWKEASRSSVFRTIRRAYSESSDRAHSLEK